MKTIRRTQMKSFEGSDLGDFTDNFNRMMKWVSVSSHKYSEPVVDLDHLRGYVVYEEQIKLPEKLQDQFDLDGLSVRCIQCSKFEKTIYSYGRCPYCKGDLRGNDECCDKMMSEWVNGDCWLKEGEEKAYEKSVDQFRCSGVCDETRVLALRSS